MCEVMKKLLSIIVLGLLWFLPASAYEIGKDVFLNACTPDPEKYFDTPLNVQDVIFEVPNKIIKLEKSKYDRDFQTLAKSNININGNKINISVSNFRDLIIKDNNGKILSEKKD